MGVESRGADPSVGGYLSDFAYRLSLLVVFLIPWGNVFESGFGSVSRYAGALLGVVWLATVVLKGGFRRGAVFHVAAAVFVTWNAASLLWSHDLDSSLRGAFAYFRMLLLAFMLWDLYVRSDRIVAGLQAYVLGAFCPVLSTIGNYLAGIESTWGRYGATGTDANSTAIGIAIALPLALHLALTPRSGRWGLALRASNYVFIPTAVFALALTGTRFGIVMSVPTVLYGVFRLKDLSMGTRVAAAGFLSVALFVAMSAVPTASIERLSTLGDEAVDGDLNGRRVFWEEGLEVWAQNPILGVGSNSFERAVPSGRAAHNSFLEILVELGLVGLLLFGGVFLATIVAVYHLPISDRLFWLTVMSVWFLGNLPLNFAGTSTTWLLFALAVASNGLPRGEREDEPSSAVAAAVA